MHPLVNALVSFFALAGGSLVASVWEGTLLAGGVALALRLLPEIPARARSVVWLGVLLLVVALPLAHARTVGADEPGVRVGVLWTVGLAAVWGLLSVLRGVRLIWSAGVLAGIARRSVTIEAPAEVAGLLRPGVRLCVSDEVSVPSVAGFFRPRILLPAGIAGKMSGSDLRQIVVHEMEHLRRRDDWTNLLQKLSLVVFPLNPALLWVERRLCAERELACDDAVLRATGAPKAYATCLASLAEHTLVQRGVSLALGAWGRRPELAKRVQRILRKREGEMSRGRAGVLVAGLLVGVMAAGVQLSRGPMMVGFSGLPVGGPSVAQSSVGVPEFFALEKPTLDSNRFAAEGGAHRVLTSARMPAVGKVRRTSFKVARVAEPKRRTRLVLTSLEETMRQPRLLTVSFEDDAHFSYAAVPVRNGWLIIQL